MQKRTKKSAFTLIELLVVIAIIAVLAGQLGDDGTSEPRSSMISRSLEWRVANRIVFSRIARPFDPELLTQETRHSAELLLKIDELRARIITVTKTSVGDGGDEGGGEGEGEGEGDGKGDGDDDDDDDGKESNGKYSTL